MRRRCKRDGILDRRGGAFHTKTVSSDTSASHSAPRCTPGVRSRVEVVCDPLTLVPIDGRWVQRAAAGVVDDQFVLPGQSRVAEPVARVEALFDAWAVGFAAERTDVPTAAFTPGSRGWHPDECAAFLRALDSRRVHVDSAGYAWPLCAEPKPGQTRYALCCKSDDGVTVNLEYLIQLGAVAELNEVHGWPVDQLRVELGEFDAAALSEGGSTAVLMEAKCRATDPRPSADTLEKLLLAWLTYSRHGPPARGTNAANKYLYLLERTREQPVKVLLAAAGARWWLIASRHGESITFDEAVSSH